MTEERDGSREEYTEACVTRRGRCSGVWPHHGDNDAGNHPPLSYNGTRAQWVHTVQVQCRADEVVQLRARLGHVRQRQSHAISQGFLQRTRRRLCATTQQRIRKTTHSTNDHTTSGSDGWS